MHYTFNYIFYFTTRKLAGQSLLYREVIYRIYWATRVTVVHDTLVNHYHVCGLRLCVISAHTLHFLSLPRRKRE